MVDKDNRVQFNLWVDKGDVKWINDMTEKYPFYVSANEFLRQLIGESKHEWENGGMKKDPSFFVYIEGKFR